MHSFLLILPKSQNFCQDFGFYGNILLPYLAGTSMIFYGFLAQINETSSQDGKILNIQMAQSESDVGFPEIS